MNKIDIKLIEEGRVALQNAKEQPTIKAELLNIGYNDEEIANGETLYQSAYESLTLKDKEYQEYSDAIAKRNALENEIQKTYMSHRKLAKRLFRNNASILSQLRLIGTFPKDTQIRIFEYKSFYNAVLTTPEIASVLEKRNISSEVLTSVLTKVETLSNSIAEAEKEFAEAQDATQSKNQKVKDFAIYISDLKLAAEIALEDHPQLLEAFNKRVLN